MRWKQKEENHERLRQPWEGKHQAIQSHQSWVGMAFTPQTDQAVPPWPLLTFLVWSLTLIGFFPCVSEATTDCKNFFFLRELGVGA